MFSRPCPSIGSRHQEVIEELEGFLRKSDLAGLPDIHTSAQRSKEAPGTTNLVAAYSRHGTNQPSTIGRFASSGCTRLTNEDVGS
jgi:hypothetical protein